MSVKNKPQDEVGCPIWMVSFGDAISLMVTFFIMLLAFSETDEAKLSEMIGAMKGGFRVTSAAMDKLAGTGQVGSQMKKEMSAGSGAALSPGGEVSKITPQELQMMKQFAMNTVGAFDKGYFIRLLDEGLTIIIYAESLFVDGTAEFLPGREAVFGAIADVAGPLRNEIRIVGVLPENARVKSKNTRTPWGLASERALAVRNKLSEIPLFKADRFGVGARAEKAGEQLATRSRDLPTERVEIILVGFRDKTMEEEIPAEEVVVSDRWK